jgi:hypothetical protein
MLRTTADRLDVKHVARPQAVYAAEFVSLALGTAVDSAVLPVELVDLVHRELSRFEELENPARDEFGNWEWPFSAAARDGTLLRPRVDEAVRTWALEEGVISPGSATRWPDNRPFAICLTHDVDFVSRDSSSLAFVSERVRRIGKAPRNEKRVVAYQTMREIAKFAAGPLLRQLREDHYHNFDSWMELEAGYGFTSTFFFFAERLSAPRGVDCGYSHSERVPFYGRTVSVAEMMREMVLRGWEIGLHASVGAATNSGYLADERAQLEHATGQAVDLVRNHYLTYDAAVTPHVQQAAGFRGDSTQGFNRGIGFRAGTSFPYRCWNHVANGPSDVLEIPMVIEDVALFHPSALGCDLTNSQAYISSMMDRISEVGGCLTANWHPSWMSDRLYRESYEFLLDEARRRRAWGCSMTDLITRLKRPLAGEA